VLSITTISQNVTVVDGESGDDRAGWTDEWNEKRLKEND